MRFSSQNSAPSSEEYEGRVELMRDAIHRMLRFLRATEQNKPLQDHLVQVMNDTALVLRVACRRWSLLTGNPLDAVIVGYYDGDQLIYAAKVRNGFVPRVRREVWQKLKGLEITVARSPTYLKRNARSFRSPVKR